MPQAQVLGRGSSGIATFATVLADKNADCHTPPAVLVRGGSTMQRMGVVSRAAVCAPFVVGLSLRFPHPYKYIIPQRERFVNSFWKIFFDRFRRNTSKCIQRLPLAVRHRRTAVRKGLDGSSYTPPHSVSRYSYGDTAIKGLSLRRGGGDGLMRLDHRPHHWASGFCPSPFDTIIIPHFARFVNTF